LQNPKPPPPPNLELTPSEESTFVDGTKDGRFSAPR
jgi:hypothetical protein